MTLPSASPFPEPTKLCQFESDGDSLRCQSCGRTLKNWSGKPPYAACGPSPRQARPQPPRATYGPGTELKKLLKRIGITATPNCKCNARARQMDQEGCDWCEQNLETISSWLQEEAASRKLPYLEAAGVMLIRQAIKNARKRMSGPGTDPT